MSDKVKENPVAKLGARVKLLKVNDKGAQVRLENVRIIWPQIAKPSQGRDGIPPSFGLTALIPKKDGARVVAEMKKISEQMLKASTFPEKKRLPALTRAFKFHESGSLFKDGDKQEKADGSMRKECQGHILYKMTSKVDPASDGDVPRPRFPFELKDKNNQPIAAHRIEEEFYGGAWCDLTFTLRPYDTAGNVGIGSFFNGAMKLWNDDRLGGAEMFGEGRADIPDESAGDMGFSGVDESEELIETPKKGKKK